MDRPRQGENSFIHQYPRNNHILQNNHNVHKSTVPPRKIFGTKKRRVSKRAEAQKHYTEATERFVAAYQSYEKTGALLQKAKVMGDLAKIDYFSYLYIKDVNNLMYTINLMDQAKKTIKHERNTLGQNILDTCLL